MAEMKEILLRPAVLAPALLLLGFVVYRLFFKKNPLAKLPLIGAKKGDWFPTIQATWRNTLDFKTAINDAYLNHKDEAVYLPTANCNSVLLPASQIQFVSEQPDNVLDMHEEVLTSLQTDYTLTDPSLAHNPIHHKVISTTLTHQIGNLVPDIAEESEWGFSQHWGDDTTAFREIGVNETIFEILGSVTNRVFVGSPLCRDPALLKAGLAYARSMPPVGQILNLFWSGLHPVIGPLLALPCHRQARKFHAILRPEIEQRLREFDAREAADAEKAAGTYPPPRNDFLQWSIAQAKAIGDPYHWRVDTLASRVLLLNLAAVHTSSMSLTSTLLDVAATPPALLEELRDEIRAQLEEHGEDELTATGHKGWNKKALAKMEKLDSFLRESARLHGFTTISLRRRVSARDGLTTPSGLHLPYGTTITVPGYPMMHDEAVYPDAEEFHPFRFAEKRSDKDVEYIQRARQAFATTSPDFLLFGHGKNACPGRFFAANELKLMLAHAVMNYDFAPLEKPPPGMWFGIHRIPSMTAKIQIRKREKAF